MAFLAVLREGLETAVFLLAAFQASTSPVAAGMGALLGIVVAVVLGWAIYRGGTRINLARFFKVTGFVLVLVAAGLMSFAAHTAHEAGWLNAGQAQFADFSAVIRPGTVWAALFTGVLGIQPKPTWSEAIAWLVYFVPMSLVILWPQAARPFHHPSGVGPGARPRTVLPEPPERTRSSMSSSSAPIRTLAVLVVAVASIATACGKDDASSKADSGSKPVTIEATLTPNGCDPANISAKAGPTTFHVTNEDADAVTEFEILDKDGKIQGEIENVTPGLDRSFSMTLKEGTYTTYCPGGKKEKGTLEVAKSGTGKTADSAATTAAVKTYLGDVESQTNQLVPATTTFVDAVKAGDVEKAKQTFAAARYHYETVEPIAESFGDLDPKIDAREGDVPAAEWGGFHRIEKQLWEAGNVDGMAPVADQLLVDVKDLQSKIAGLELEPAQIANGAVELLNEVSASKITGEEDRYSHTDLSDFAGNVEGAQFAFTSVKPLLAGDDADAVGHDRPALRRRERGARQVQGRQPLRQRLRALHVADPGRHAAAVRRGRRAGRAAVEGGGTGDPVTDPERAADEAVTVSRRGLLGLGGAAAGGLVVGGFAGAALAGR